jgi:imidazolonepropionase-like amidohydrolase
MIPGLGAPVENAAIIISNDNGTISYAGLAASMPKDLNITDKYQVPVAMPGMWDAHTHYGGSTCSLIDDVQSEFHDLAAGYFPHSYTDFGCALQMLRETVCAGITSVRELGGFFGQALRPLVESGLFPSPNFHYASHAIGMTGGHADQQYLPISITRRDYNDQFDMFGALCDGPAMCMQKVREQLRQQADVIKIMTTGGVLSAFVCLSD